MRCWSLSTGKTAFSYVDNVGLAIGNLMGKDYVSAALSISHVYRKIEHILNIKVIKEQPNQYFYYEKSFHPEVAIVQFYGFFFLQNMVYLMTLYLIIKEK